MRVNAFAVHEQVRVHRRLEMLKALAKTGLPIHLVGGGYDRDLYRFKSMVHLGERPLPAVVAMMRSAKVVLSVNANFGQGSHERPLSAMLAGAAAATDGSAFYDDAFAADEIIQLSWTHLGRDLEALGRLMQDPAALHRTAVAGQARASAAHRWDHRVGAILRAAEAVRQPA